VNSRAEARAVFDALFGLGRLQRLLEDPDISDIHVNGCDSVHVRRRDGTRVQGEPIAESDDELVDLIRLAATRFGRTERRFDAANPELNLQLPDGSRLFGVMSVSGRPSLAIRLHHLQKITLADLRGLGMIDGAVMASDAFFPFADGPEEGIAAGVKAVIQPGGSRRDPEVIEACNTAGIAMVFTGRRHFRH